MKRSTKVVAALCALLLAGCVSWTPKQAGSTPAFTPPPEATNSFSALDKLAVSVSTREELQQSIAAHQQFLADHPRHRPALTALADQWLLYGAAYAEGRGAKQSAFLAAKQTSEQAMSTDPGYAGRISKGAQPWEACSDLGRPHMNAMLFWVTSVLYMFRDGMVFPQQIVESQWLDHAGRMLDHMLSIDRQWSGGATLFSKAIVYHSVPPAAGGDPEKARAFLAEAIDVKGDWMLPRWGRAKYFLVEPGDRDARRADLRAVLAMDPSARREAPYWRRFFQQDARRMLAEIDSE